MFLKHTAMRLEDEGLGGMKPGKVGCASGRVGEVNAKHRLGFAKKLARLFEECSSLWLYSSMPSRRISCINGIRGSL
jgi:hypothetical protein